MNDEGQVRITQVVYADAIGYTKLDFAQKRRYDERLNVLAGKAYEGLGVLARVDNGDGFAFALGGALELIVEATLQLREALHAQTGVRTRFAIHIDLAAIRPDLNGAASLTGPAIEGAQRLMAASDGEAVVVSETVKNLLRSFPSFAGRVGFPRWSRTKHGEPLVAVPLLRMPMPRVCVIGDPGTATYAQLAAKLVENRSVDWAFLNPEFRAESFAAQLASDAEALWFEAQPGESSREVTARGITLLQLPEALDAAVEKILHAVGPLVLGKICTTGPVPLQGAPYIRRRADQELLDAIQRRESVVHLRAPAGFGKSSLLARIGPAVRALGSDLWSLDLGACDEPTLGSIEGFYRWMIDALAHQVGAPTPPWEEWIGPNSNLENAVASLGKGRPITVLFDGVERLFSAPYRHDFFGLLRSWHNRRALDQSALWARLSMLLAYSGDAQSVLLDVNQSPFNVGFRIDLSPFSLAELTILARASGGDPQAIHEMTGGHPTLSAELAAAGWTETLAETAYQHLRREPFLRHLAVLLTQEPSLASVRKQSKPETLWKALSLGLVTLDLQGKPCPANPMMGLLLAEYEAKPS